jgi:hypothetical protein
MRQSFSPTSDLGLDVYWRGFIYIAALCWSMAHTLNPQFAPSTLNHTRSRTACLVMGASSEVLPVHIWENSCRAFPTHVRGGRAGDLDYSITRWWWHGGCLARHIRHTGHGGRSTLVSMKLRLQWGD